MLNQHQMDLHGGNVSLDARRDAATQEEMDLALGELPCQNSGAQIRLAHISSSGLANLLSFAVSVLACYHK